MAKPGSRASGVAGHSCSRVSSGYLGLAQPQSRGSRTFPVRERQCDKYGGCVQDAGFSRTARQYSAALIPLQQGFGDER